MVLTALVACFAGTGCSSFPLHGVTLDSEHRLNGEATLSAFAPARQRLQNITAIIEDRWKKPVALATMFDPTAALAVTKWSEIKSEDDLTIRLPSGKSGPLAIRAVSEANDLALVSAEPKRFADIHRVSTAVASEGNWVTALTTEKALRVGIVSGKSRQVIKPGGQIGVFLDVSGSEGAHIQSLLRKSPAEKAGLQAGDLITAVNGKVVDSALDLITTMSFYQPGSSVRLTIKRNGQTMHGTLRLADPAISKGDDRNLKMSGRVSNRRAGFARVIQHDTLLSPEDMGGPLGDLEGNVVGVNIARSDRVSTYAIPIDVIRDLVEEMTP